MAMRSKTDGKRPNEGPLPDPLGFFLTWTTYGTWLPGDERGWVKWHQGFQRPDARIKAASQALMNEEACYLDGQQRTLVEQTVRDHCRIRGWQLHAVSGRTNHVHVVVSARWPPKTVRNELKAWCTRKLNERQAERRAPARDKWWTERGSIRPLDDEDSLEAAIRYVLDGQDRRDEQRGAAVP